MPNKETDPALGRSWGGFRTRIPSLADRQGRPLCLRVTDGPRPDRIQTLVVGWPDAPRSGLSADRA